MLADRLPNARFLLADKAYDADHYRARLKQLRIQPVIPTNPIENYPMLLTRNDTDIAMSLSVCLAGSRISDVSQHDTINTPQTLWQHYASLLSYVTGFE